jgi:hypothetical protein
MRHTHLATCVASSEDGERVFVGGARASVAQLTLDAHEVVSSDDVRWQQARW